MKHEWWYGGGSWSCNMSDSCDAMGYSYDDTGGVHVVQVVLNVIHVISENT